MSNPWIVLQCNVPILNCLHDLFSHHKHENDVGEHDYDYDHEAFLGDEAEEFDHLTPEESQHRLALIVDKIDQASSCVGDGPTALLVCFILKCEHHLRIRLHFPRCFAISAVINRYPMMTPLCHVGASALSSCHVKLSLLLSLESLPLYSINVRGEKRSQYSL